MLGPLLLGVAGAMKPAAAGCLAAELGLSGMKPWPVGAFCTPPATSPLDAGLSIVLMRRMHDLRLLHCGSRRRCVDVLYLHV
jgi:hypothetical protein